MDTFTVPLTDNNSKDTYIRSSLSNNGDYGLDSNTLLVAGWGDYYYSFLQFEIGDFPSEVDSATLRLYQYRDNAGGEWTHPSMSLYTVSGNWEEGLQWPDNNTNATFQMDLEAPEGVGWYEIDITDIYRAWKNDPASNFGIQLRPFLEGKDSEPLFAKRSLFYSSDNGAPLGKTPELVIDPVDVPVAESFRHPLGSANTDILTEKDDRNKDSGDSWTLSGNDFGYDKEFKKPHLGEDWNYIDAAGNAGDIETTLDEEVVVYAAANGQVVDVGDQTESPGRSFGHYVILKHTLPSEEYNGYVYTLYAHLQPNSVTIEEDQIIEKGTPFAKVGRSGLTSGETAHLHFELFHGNLGEAFVEEEIADAVAEQAYTDNYRMYVEKNGKVKIHQKAKEASKIESLQYGKVTWLNPTDFISDHLASESVVLPPSESIDQLHYSDAVTGQENYRDRIAASKIDLNFIDNSHPVSIAVPSIQMSVTDSQLKEQGLPTLAVF